MGILRDYEKGTYRFALDKSKPRKKLTCPNCGRPRCFTPYVDVVTGKMVDPRFGICDHVNKCGYKRYPKGVDVGERELFVDPNRIRPEYAMPDIDDIANRIDTGKVLETGNPRLSNTLLDYLSGVFGKERARRAFDLYKVGSMPFADWGMCPVFWQIDRDFNVRTGKIMGYDERGKRVKEPMSRVCWYHTMDGSDFLLRQCLFGEHLLNFFPDNAPVNVVESEKTALICSMATPDKLFMATGGLNNIRMGTFLPLKGRVVRLWPDKGAAFDKWKSKAESDLYDLNVEVDPFLQDIDWLDEGADMGDYILERKIKEKNKRANGEDKKERKGLQGTGDTEVRVIG